MKKIRILCLALAALMVVRFFAGCTKKVTATVSIRFVSTDDNGEEVEHFKRDNYAVNGTTKELPTVLSAVEQAFAEYEITYELSDDGTYLASAFDKKQRESSDGETGYFWFWECTINGELSNTGRQSVTQIYDGDEIVFTWTEGSKAVQTTTAPVTTDPNAETTGVIHSNETTAAQQQQTQEIA